MNSVNAFQIKLIAVITMAIAHIGLFFFPTNYYLYFIGRLSFPLFSWLIANGAHHTKDMHLYAKRILILGVISQVPFILANRVINSSYWRLNVLFAYFLALVGIIFLKKLKSPPLKIILVIGLLAATHVFKIDFDFLGVASVLIFYFFEQSKVKMIAAQTLLFGGYSIYSFIEAYSRNVLSYYKLTRLMPIALLSLFFINYYNGKEGPKSKYLFYIFYPLHYLVIYLLLTIT